MLNQQRDAENLPASVLFDNFNGADGVTLVGRVPPVHPNANTWSVPQGSFVTNAGMAEARFTSTSPALLNVDMGTPDGDFRVRIIFPTTGNNRSGGILFRRVNNSNYWYTIANIDSGNYRIIDFTSSVATVLAETNFNFLADVPYDMRLILVGDRIISTIDGVATLSVESSIRNTASLHGLRGANQVGQGPIKFEDFTVLDPPPPADVYITVDPSVLLTSSYNSSITHVSASDLRLGNATARERAKDSLATALDFHRISTHLYGVNDPWHWDGTGIRPSEPWNWTSLDATIQMVKDMAGTPILGFGNWSWHLKGRWFGGTDTVPCTFVDAFDENGRPLTNEIENIRLMARRTFQRYLASPHNIRWWQLTNWEAHGFERGRDGGFDNQGFDAYAGTPGQADMGMAYLHNVVYEELIAVATDMEIDRSELHIVTGYFRIATRGVPNSESVSIGHDLREKVWGTASESGITAVLGHLPLLTAGSWDYWSYDIGSLNKDGVALTDDITNNEKFTDVAVYMNTQVAALGYGDKSCIISERYTKPLTDPGTGAQQYRAMIFADAERRFIAEGIAQAMIWSPVGRANEPGAEEEAGLITSVATSSGGQTQETFDVVKMYHDNFSAGTPIHSFTQSGAGLSAIPNDVGIALINLENNSKIVNVNGTITTTVAPYGVKYINY